LAADLHTQRSSSSPSSGDVRSSAGPATTSLSGSGALSGSAGPPRNDVSNAAASEHDLQELVRYARVWGELSRGAAFALLVSCGGDMALARDTVRENFQRHPRELPQPPRSQLRFTRASTVSAALPSPTIRNSGLPENCCVLRYCTDLIIYDNNNMIFSSFYVMSCDIVILWFVVRSRSRLLSGDGRG
jgi:hypothetical protein